MDPEMMFVLVPAILTGALVYTGSRNFYYGAAALVSLATIAGGLARLQFTLLHLLAK